MQSYASKNKCFVLLLKLIVDQQLYLSFTGESFTMSCKPQLYDFMVITISSIDTITDLCVLHYFWSNQYIQFSIILTIIIGIAHLSFAINATVNVNSTASACITCRGGINFIFSTLLRIACSPFIPISHSMSHCPNSTSNALKYIPKDNRMIRWIHEKREQHFPYILHALFESSPSFILQWIALKYLHDTLSVISIIFSFLSVAVKYPLFGPPLTRLLTTDIPTMCLCWFSWISDIMSCIWYCSCFYFSDSDHLGMSLYFRFVTLKLIFCVVPYSITISLHSIIRKSRNCRQTRHGFIVCLCSAFPELWTLSLLSLWNATMHEIRCTSYIPVIIALITKHSYSTKSIPMSHTNERLRHCLLQFVRYGPQREEGALCIDPSWSTRCRLWIESALLCHLHSPWSSPEYLRRILAVNYCLLTAKRVRFSIEEYPILHSYLLQMLDVSEDEFCTFSNLRKATQSLEISDLYGQIARLYGAHCSVSEYFSDRFHRISFLVDIMMRYLWCPLYIGSRFLSIITPFVLVIGSWIYEQKIGEIHLFLRVWVHLQCAVMVIVLWCGVESMRLHYWWWHVVPGFEKNGVRTQWLMQMSAMDSVLSRIWFYYDEMRYRELRSNIVQDVLGKTVGQVVLDFVGRFRLTEHDWIPEEE